MMRRLLALPLFLALAAPARAETAGLDWQKWDPVLFDRAAREDKYILLHMAAVWCHWCHVMERTTYRDPAVQQRIADKFIPVRVDQDSDPALSYRYESWGWPATIMLDKDGNEIFKRRGYIPPELFARLLAAVIEDPSALPSYSVGAAVDPNAVALAAERRGRIEALMLKTDDRINGGFGDTHRFIQGDTVEWALERGRPLQRNPDPAPWREAAGQDSRRRASPDRPGVGRHVPVFRQARLVGPALREAAEYPARRPSQPTCSPGRSAAIPPISPQRATSRAG